MMPARVDCSVVLSHANVVVGGVEKAAGVGAAPGVGYSWKSYTLKYPLARDLHLAERCAGRFIVHHDRVRAGLIV